MARRPLKILLGHCFYRSTAPSGEDAVFENEWQLLEKSGVTIIPFLKRNDDLDDSNMHGRMKVAMDTIWCTSTHRELKDLLRREKPDLAHFHNTFPQISPSAYDACHSVGVPVVQTLHNYRLICANALLLRKGQPCEDCVGSHPVFGLWPGLRHRCYRGSTAATGALTLMLASNRLRGSYQNVDRYIALTEFASSRLAAGGLPADRMVVKPNFLPDPPPPGDGRGAYALYVGRLSEEKGVRTLLRAWRGLDNIPLLVAGDGPLGPFMRQTVADLGLAVEFLGLRTHQDVLRLVGDAAMLVVPSEWYEGLPMVVLEAFACGTPVLASRIGSLDEIVQEGVTGAKFRAGDAAELRALVQHLVADPRRLAGMRRHVREEFDLKYTPEQNLRQLLEIYEQVLAQRGQLV